jgi:sugar O-acyltransferase (sialic acid O-acetyltransferase NeuD family)
MGSIVIFGLGRGANLATRYFRNDSQHEIVAYTVDDSCADRHEFMGRPVIPFSRIEKEIPPEESEMFILLGFQEMNSLRAAKFAEAKRKGYSLANYISSKILASENLKTGENCFILEGNVFNHDVTIGDNVVMWSGNHVGDLSVIEDNVFVSSHVVLSGDVTIGANSFLGVNATVSNYVRVGARCYVGANSLVTHDTPPDSVYIAKPTPKLENIDSLRFLQVIKS